MYVQFQFLKAIGPCEHIFNIQLHTMNEVGGYLIVATGK